MKKGKPKTPYVLFGVAVLYNAFAMAVAVIIFLFMKETAANFTMKLLMSLIPIIAAIVIFLDLRFKFKDIKAYRQAQ
jgi:type IV secretory pathway VirB3-like protein